MDKANQIQIGMLGVILLLLILQIAGVFGGSGASSNALRSNARQNLTTPPATPAANNPATPAAPAAPVGPATVMAFKQDKFDFGTVNEGEKVEHVFSFENTGDEPLTITKAKGSCGCTVPNYPKEPIPPGQSGEIKVVFDSKGKTGKRNQTVTIDANTNPPQTIISLVGEVIKDPNSPAATTAQPNIQINK